MNMYKVGDIWYYENLNTGECWALINSQWVRCR
jgi:hypothetical protein